MTTQSTSIDPTQMLKPRRKLTGISAILLTLTSDHQIDEESLRAHIARTAEHGLIPAVNMDTGYVNLIDDTWRRRVLEITKETMSGQPFVAGAFVKDNPGDSFHLGEYTRQMGMIEEFGGTPVIFQSFGLVEQDGYAIVEAYKQIADKCDKFIGFELTKELAPFGAVYDLETYEGLLGIEKCLGAKHSSFHREPEWERLQLRDAKRPDFKVFTGNDFAIDMVQYGSDYLLGLSTFAPDLFAKRDKYWEQGDTAFYELNDQLQYLGFFAFRSPGPGYKHTAAQFLNLRGWCSTNETHPDSPERPDSDIAVLKELGERLGVL